MNDGRFDALSEAAGPVSRETFDRLIAFEAMFTRWASRINLSAPSTLPMSWQRHILDSAQLLPLVPAARRWIDLGSGGGFPGMVLAVLLSPRSDARIDLVESNGKKAAFLRNAAAALGVKAGVHAMRIEEARSVVPEADIVTARALAPLPRLLELAGPWLREGAVGLFHKGRDYRHEVKESRDGWDFDLVEHPSITDPEGAVLELSHVRQRLRD